MARSSNRQDVVNAVNVNLLIACALVAFLVEGYDLKGWGLFFAVYSVAAAGQWLNKKTLKVP
jgi:hypothetical protein